MLGWRGLLEILILGLIFYYLFRLLRGTRGVPVLFGAIIFFLSLLGLSYLLDLRILGWALKNLAPYLLIAFFVIFQPEMRRGLAEIGRSSMLNPGRTNSSRGLVENVTAAAAVLAERKIGALIAIERNVGLREVTETGSPVDSAVSSEILTSIFFPRAPLHDGGVIIQEDRISCAACVFPLTEQQGIAKNLGTRHRAAIGLTEVCDAAVVVVSEETGTISLAYKGDLRRGLDAKELSDFLAKILHRPMEAKPKPSAPKPEISEILETIVEEEKGPTLETIEQELETKEVSS